MATGNQRPKLTPGVDAPLFYLDAECRWRLASDGLQWIIQKRGGIQHKGRYAGELRWKGVRFPTTPEVLRRDMRELGTESTAEALRRIAEFPTNVARWKWDGRSLEGDDADVEREPHLRLPEALDGDVDQVVAAAKAGDYERANELAAEYRAGKGA